MDVPLRDYVAGAALVTDLVLTAPGLRLGDRLTSTAELRALLDEHDVPHGRVTRTDLDDVRTLRTELMALFDSGDNGDTATILAAGNRLLAACPHRVTVGPEHAEARNGDWRVSPDAVASLAQRLSLIAGVATLAVVHALGAQRFRTCAATDSCTGRFVDTSGTGRRRFCLPKVCGNRVNVARYRARRSAAR